MGDIPGMWEKKGRDGKNEEIGEMNREWVDSVSLSVGHKPVSAPSLPSFFFLFFIQHPQIKRLVNINKSLDDDFP